MTSNERLQKLKELQIIQKDGQLFRSANDCMIWIDNVAPLLRYDQQHYYEFLEHAKIVRITSLTVTTLMPHLYAMIGIVNQVIIELENNMEPAKEESSKEPNATTTEQFEAIIKMYSEGTLDERSVKELKQCQAFLLKHGAMNGLNETTYYQMLGYIEDLIVSKTQEKSHINKNVIAATNSTVVVGDSNVIAKKTENNSKKAWHETSIFKIKTGTVLTSLLVAYLVYRFQWK